MDFSDRELRVLLQALYRFRGEVSGASQSEQNKLGLVSSVIDKIEAKAGPVRAERSLFDEEMAKNLSVLTTGKARVATGKARVASGGSKAGAAKVGAKQRAKLDNGDAAHKVKKAASSKAKPSKASSATARASGPKKAGSGKTRS